MTPTQPLRLAVAVYLATTILLFGVSASYHLGAGGPRTQATLHRLDHANIYLFIAGSYTPLAAALPDRTTGTVMLVLVWSIALLGLVVRVGGGMHPGGWSSVRIWLWAGCRCSSCPRSGGSSAR